MFDDARRWGGGGDGRDRPLQYILADRDTPVPEPDAMRWAMWKVEQFDKPIGESLTIVGRDVLHPWCVSTVFLGIDTAVFSPFPILFETMVSGQDDQLFWRWSTWRVAEAAHAAILSALPGLIGQEARELRELLDAAVDRIRTPR
jgi:hypothetical protein